MPTHLERYRALQQERRRPVPVRTVSDDVAELIAVLAQLLADAHHAAYAARRR